MSDAEVTPTEPTVLRCAIPTPLRRFLDYLVPKDSTTSRFAPGQRVIAPLGNRRLTGIIVEVNPKDSFDRNKLRPLDAVLDDEPLLDERQLTLLEWTSRYYMHPPGKVFPLALSLRERRGEPPAPTGEPGFKLTLRGQGLPKGGLKRAPKQAELLSRLQQRAHSVSELERQGIQRSIMRTMASKALIEPCDIKPAQQWKSGTSLAANDEQRRTIDAISATLGGYKPHLLAGVTGSGKTEVYLQIIANCLQAAKQALVLLPEIGLTPQTVERFRQRFDAPVVVLHSGLADGERDRGWAMARNGEAAVIIGTRSAVFTPCSDLGLIVVDEEHDGTYSQQDGLRYSARDIAVMRAHLEGCPIVLGSATPSLESLQNANRGRYQLHRLTQRAVATSQPSGEIVDVRGLALTSGLSSQLIDAVHDTLNRGEQALLFLNRRGFAPSLLCHDCGWVAGCHQCDARMTVHRHPPSLCCHHCNSRSHLPQACPQCNSKRLQSSGVGTEQTEQALQRFFPERPIYRVDSDSMSGRTAMQDFRDAVANEGPAIILGTQMLSKGHDFPKVTLVGVLDADALLFNTDFRGEERFLQLITQVAGRAGRAQYPGKVMIQTHHPEHPLVLRALQTDYIENANQLLEARQRQALPPHGAIAVMRADSRSTSDGLTFLSQVTADSKRLPAVVVGPIPAAMARRAGLYRSQLIITGNSRGAVAATMQALVDKAGTLPKPAGLNWFVDIDPIETL